MVSEKGFHLFRRMKTTLPGLPIYRQVRGGKRNLKSWGLALMSLGCSWARPAGARPALDSLWVLLINGPNLGYVVKSSKPGLIPINVLLVKYKFFQIKDRKNEKLIEMFDPA